LPSGSGWSFEVEWDGFRALVSTEDGLRVRSRRGWNMTEAVPELAALPPGLVLDGELVAWNEGEPWFPDVCHRVLNRDMTIPLTLIVFDVLAINGDDMTNVPFIERRSALERLDLNGSGWATSEVFEDGEAPSSMRSASTGWRASSRTDFHVSGACRVRRAGHGWRFGSSGRCSTFLA